MRNWYEAICEDLNIDLIKLCEKHPGHISDKPLRGYRDTGEVPPRKNSRKAVLALIRKEEKNFTKDLLKAYFDGEHEKKPSDKIKQSCINKIQQALKSVKEKGIKLDIDKRTHQKRSAKIAAWIYQKILMKNGYQEIGRFLEAIRSQIKTRTQYDVVRELHNAIAPLAIMDSAPVSQSRNKVCSLLDDTNLSTPAMAGLGISRSQGNINDLKLDADDKGINYFPPPQNAVIEDSFAPGDGEIKQRIARRLLIKVGRLATSAEENQTDIDDSLFNDLEIYGEMGVDSLEQPYIYLKNSLDYPKEQFEDIIDIKGFHKFADYSDQKITLFNSRYAYLWLIGLYSKLETIDKGFESMDKIKAMINTISNPEVHQLLEQLKNTGDTMNATDYLDNVDKVISIAANGSNAVDNSLSLYEKATYFLSQLPDAIEKLGGAFSA